MAYITTPADAIQCFDEMPSALCLIGHTHVAEYYHQRQGTRSCEQVSLWSGGRLNLESDLRYIVNPGATGQPRDGNSAAGCGIFDTEAGVIEVRRVSYEVAATQEKMRGAALPDYLIQRLAVGR
jgi:diadenosine tetraphosphatase ApaH/serine/threonine PP2A family protein phosphatase